MALAFNNVKSEMFQFESTRDIFQIEYDNCLPKFKSLKKIQNGESQR